jgi:hypothetical protein
MTSDTITVWRRRQVEQRSRALVQLREPVKKFPEFVSYLM